MKIGSTLRRLSAFSVALLLLFACLPSFSASADEPEPTFFESFESGMSGWESTASAPDTSVTRTSAAASHGSSSVLLRDAATNRSLSLISPKITLKSGVYYRVSVDVFNISGNGSVFLWFYNASGTQTDAVSSTVTSTGKWNTAEFTVTLPEGASRTLVPALSGSTTSTPGWPAKAGAARPRANRTASSFFMTTLLAKAPASGRGKGSQRDKGDGLKRCAAGLQPSTIRFGKEGGHSRHSG